MLNTFFWNAAKKKNIWEASCACFIMWYMPFFLALLIDKCFTFGYKIMVYALFTIFSLYLSLAALPLGNTTTIVVIGLQIFDLLGLSSNCLQPCPILSLLILSIQPEDKFVVFPSFMFYLEQVLQTKQRKRWHIHLIDKERFISERRWVVPCSLGTTPTRLYFGDTIVTKRSLSQKVRVKWTTMTIIKNHHRFYDAY